MEEIKKRVWQLNAAFDSLSQGRRVLAVLIVLFGLPLTVCLALGLSFEDETAQAAWLVWVLWALAPRVWYRHATGSSPWKR